MDTTEGDELQTTEASPLDREGIVKGSFEVTIACLSFELQNYDE